MLYPSTGERLAAPIPRPNIVRLMAAAPITKAEAEAVHQNILNSFETIGAGLKFLRDTEGWKLLTDGTGQTFKNWTDYLNRSFKHCRQYLYELMRAADVNERLSSIGYNLNTSQACAIAQYPQDVQIPILETTKARYGKLTESNISRVGDALTQIVATGHLNPGDGDSSTAFEGHMTREDEEAFKRQSEYIQEKGKKREYIHNREPFTVNGSGQVVITGLPAGAVVFFSIWTESE